jgi:hypothetical protein
MMFEYAPSKRLDPHDPMSFDYSAATLRRQSSPRQSAPTPAATASRVLTANVAAAGTPAAARPSVNPTPSSAAPSPTARGLRRALPSLTQLLRSHRAALVAVLVVALVLGTLVRHAEWLHATLPGDYLGSEGPRFTHLQAATATQTPTSSELARTTLAAPSSASDPAAAPPSNVTAATAVPPIAAILATTTEPARQDLSGNWRGEYVDASGKQLLRVVSLSISRVHEDGGIEGTLQYEASSGDGECQFHPRGSSYSAGAQRLQLSPEGCSPHYPRELGVPLDFESVNPQATTLEDGRIEAPTGEVIRVKLKRVSGA